MKRNINMLLYFVTFIPVTKGAIPGTFFWKPRLGLDLTVPTTEATTAVLKPTKANIASGKVVIFDGYQAGLTIIALASGFPHTGDAFPHLNPTSAYYYTNAYRWALRYTSLLPSWLGGQGGHYCDTHKVWRRRFHYMEEFVPQWLRSVLFFVDKNEWAKEEEEFKQYKKFAEPAFGKHYRYPNKKFDNFNSQRTRESQIKFERSSIDIK